MKPTSTLSSYWFVRQSGEMLVGSIAEIDCRKQASLTMPAASSSFAATLRHAQDAPSISRGFAPLDLVGAISEPTFT